MNNYIDNHFILQNITILGVKREPLNATIIVNEYPINHYFYNKTEKVIFFYCFIHIKYLF